MARVLLNWQFALLVCPQWRWSAGWIRAHQSLRSNVLANWATGIGGAVGGGGSNKAGEAEDVLGAITSGRGGGSAVAGAWGKQQQQLPESLHPPSPESRASLARDAMARLSLSSLPS
jgi:hypothetical protein